MESILENGKPCCRLMQKLENNIAILGEETRHTLQIITALDSKIEWFSNVSTSLSNKLYSLRSFVRSHDSVDNEIAEFVQQISNSWMNANKQISKKYSGIRVASRMFPGVPLSLMLDKMKKEIILAKLSLQEGDVTYCKKHMPNGYYLFNKCARILHSLEGCDNKVQQYLVISKITPYLMQLELTIEKFVSGIELLPAKENASSDSIIFSKVVKLLTGELLGHEPMNPHQVLAENVPKKPIFIIKNNRRRMEIPTITALKTVCNTADFSIINK